MQKKIWYCMVLLLCALVVCRSALCSDQESEGSSGSHASAPLSDASGSKLFIPRPIYNLIMRYRSSDQEDYDTFVFCDLDDGQFTPYPLREQVYLLRLKAERSCEDLKRLNDRDKMRALFYLTGYFLDKNNYLNDQLEDNDVIVSRVEDNNVVIAATPRNDEIVTTASTPLDHELLLLCLKNRVFITNLIKVWGVMYKKEVQVRQNKEEFERWENVLTSIDRLLQDEKKAKEHLESLLPERDEVDLLKEDNNNDLQRESS
ncbi:MAG: hypothetical protein WBQ73_00410 [Candidatus Babeliales bacterium]